MQKTIIRVILGFVAIAAVCATVLVLFSDPGAEPVYTIEHSLEIPAPVDAVWSVLADFPAYGEWNPYLPEIKGTLAAGEILDVKLVQSGLSTLAEPLSLKPLLVKVELGTAFAWTGTLAVAGIHDTYHAFELRDLGDGTTRIHQFEEFRGFIPWLLKDGDTMKDTTRASFETMNTLLRDRVLDTAVE